MPPSPEGNIELVPTSKIPQPHAQPKATPGAKTPANKPPPILIICEFNFLFFIFKVKDCENANRRPQVKGNKFRPRLTTLAGKNCGESDGEGARRRHRRLGKS
jgi:hypothetical protein